MPPAAQDLNTEVPELAGLSGSLPGNGDYDVDRILGRSVLLLRDSAGQVRAFLNACRYRGAPVAQQCGRATRRFVGPYHAWT